MTRRPPRSTLVPYRTLFRSDVEAVREEERSARVHVRRDVALVDLRLDLVGQEHRHDLRAAYGVRDRPDGDAGLLRLRPRRAALAQADLDRHAAVVEVQRVRVRLAAPA